MTQWRVLGYGDGMWGGRFCEGTEACWGSVGFGL